MSEGSKKRRRRLTSFNLRTGLIAVTILGVWLGLHWRGVRRQRSSVEAMARFGSEVLYDYQYAQQGLRRVLKGDTPSPVPAPLLNALGRDHFHDVVFVLMPPSQNLHVRSDKSTGDLLLHLSGFPRLQCLFVSEVTTDEGIREVSNLTGLRSLHVGDARASVALTDGGSDSTSFPGKGWMAAGQTPAGSRLAGTRFCGLGMRTLGFASGQDQNGRGEWLPPSISPW